MAARHSFLPQIKKLGSLYAKLVFANLAFVLMVLSSSIFVRNMLRNYLHRDATNILTQTRHSIEAEFIEPQTTLIAISENIRSMILHGSNAYETLETMRNIGHEMQLKPDGFIFENLFGYFEAFGGVYLTTSSRNISEDYDPAERPWYQAAVKAGGTTAATAVYYNARLDTHIITLTRRIFDDEGQPLGVICMDVPLDRIKNSAANMHLTGNSYGMLLDENFDIIYHPSHGMIGMNVSEIESGVAQLGDSIRSGEVIFEREVNNYQDILTIVFSARFENGWVLLNVTPKAEYYHDLNNMMLILVTLGGLLATTLSIILIYVERAKNRADEENRQKGIALASLEKIREEEERTQIMFDATPLGCKLWDKNLNLIECNKRALELFDLRDKQEFYDKFFELSPEYQPDGNLSKEKAAEYVQKAFDEGYYQFEWMHQKLNGEPIPSEIILVRIMYKGEYVVAGYIRDLREYKQMMKKIEQRDNLLNTVNHTAALLLATENEENMKGSILKGMELLGCAVDVDRVQIWQNKTIDGILYFALNYEWLSEIGKQKAPVPADLKIPYSEKPEWESKFLRGEYINSLLSELPPDDRDFLSPYDIKSIVIIPLFLQDRFWGFFSLDDCHNGRTFTEEEINILRSGGLLIANAFLRSDMLQNIRTGAVRLETALKEAQAANTAKSKFLATMSHEIRTPMNVILGVTESQLLNTAISQEIKEAFEKIYNSGDLLLHIINDILDLSKIEADKFELNPANYEILSLINDAANLNVMQFGHKQIEFNLHVDENLPVFLHGDELRIKQILNNILSNAFKYTDSGEIVLSLTAENTTDEQTTLIFSVSDTGQGMTEEQIQKLFDEYARFNLETNRSTVGTGLGMAITNNLIKMMGGAIHVESAPGKGSLFTVKIPQKITSPGLLGREAMENFKKFHFTDKVQKKKAVIHREPMPYGRVMIVDDMKSNLDVAKLLLKPYELYIDTASSGNEALTFIKNGNVYDIIFMDHMMPEMDGMEATKKIRGMGYTHPIFALTANAVTGQQEMFLANGFDGYISKPIDLRQLNDSLNKHIRDKERGRKKAEAKAAMADTAADPAAEAQLRAAIITSVSIPGIDTEKGLALYDGNMEIYISILRSFVPNALSNIEKLRGVTQETLPDYAITVHGMKSICANIGAEHLRAAAFNLETMAKSGDLKGVTEINEMFLAETEEAVSEIQAWLKENDTSLPKPQLPHPDRSLLILLYQHCAAFDMKGIDNVLERLEGANYDRDGELVSWLREKINESDFTSVIERLAVYVSESILR